MLLTLNSVLFHVGKRRRQVRDWPDSRHAEARTGENRRYHRACGAERNGLGATGRVTRDRVGLKVTLIVHLAFGTTEPPQVLVWRESPGSALRRRG